MINRITIMDKEKKCECDAKYHKCQGTVRKYQFMGILKDDGDKTERYWCMECLRGACDVGDTWVNLEDEIDELSEK